MVAATVMFPCVGSSVAWAQGSEPRLLIPPTGTGTTGPSSPPTIPPPTSTIPQVTAAPPTGAALARLDVRITQLEQDLRTVTGRLEEVAYQVRKLDERLNKALADMEYRLGQTRPDGDGETNTLLSGASTGGGSAGTAAAIAAGASIGAARPAPPSATSVEGLPPREQYARSLNLLEKRRYEDAAAGFSEFLKQNPNDPLVDNARYWLGESYYARGDYTQAAQTFLEGYEKAKKGPKAPDTLLKLGLSLSALNKTKEACATFRELSKVFPSAPEPVRERAAQESKRIGCS